MSDLIDPNTNRSINQDRILKEMQRWTLDRTIIRAMWRAGMAHPDQLVNLAVRIAATLRPEDQDLASYSKPLTPRETAICALQFLNCRDVRMQIAKVVAVQMQQKKAEVMRDLWAMREFLQENYSVKEVQKAAEQGLVILG
jgi:hypothetical protein